MLEEKKTTTKKTPSKITSKVKVATSNAKEKKTAIVTSEKSVSPSKKVAPKLTKKVASKISSVKAEEILKTKTASKKSTSTKTTKTNTSKNSKPVTKVSGNKAKFTSKASETHPWLKNYPSNIKWDVLIEEKPLYTLLQETVKKIPHRPCVDFLGKKFTYGKIGDLVNRAAKGLQNLGVKKGTKVGLFMPNAHYYVVMYFAILQAGGVVVNYNPLYSDSEVEHQIRDSETEIMVTLDLELFYQKLLPLLNKTPMKKLIVCSVANALPFPKNWLFPILRHKDKAHVIYNEQVINYANIITNDGKYKAVEVDPKKDLALLQYTGGTTGVPKGAMLSHANVYANALQAEMWFTGYTYGQERILAALPLFHVFAMTAVMTLAIKTGAEIVLMFPRFNVDEAIWLITKHKITFFPAVPTIYGMINNHKGVSKFDLSSLRMCLSGGAGLPWKIKEDFESLTKCKVVEAYGLSETSPAATSNPMFGENKTGSIGLPFPGTTIKIVSLDDPSVEVPLGEKGQIAIKGPQVMNGYWNHPIETKKSFVGDYFLTGDVGYMDEDGYTFLVDRIKDVIICSGFNVYPRMIEEVIYKHPDIDEVTVIGVADEKRGETVKAFVKLKEEHLLTPEELFNFLQGKLSPIEMPKYIEFREQLPKTMIGKLSKKELKAEEHGKAQ